MEILIATRLMSALPSPSRRETWRWVGKMKPSNTGSGTRREPVVELDGNRSAARPHRTVPRDRRPDRLSGRSGRSRSALGRSPAGRRRIRTGRQVASLPPSAGKSSSNASPLEPSPRPGRLRRPIHATLLPSGPRATCHARVTARPARGSPACRRRLTFLLTSDTQISPRATRRRRVDD
jgi:hypothetical protein